MSEVERWAFAVTAAVFAINALLGCAEFSKEEIQQLIDCCPMGEVP